MKMAKPSQRDIDAAGDLMTILHQIDRGDYPCTEEGKDVPDWFDEYDYEHLRAFCDAIKATFDKGPGYPGRVIGGMCYVVMYDKNEIVDPDSDTIDLHPKLVEALRFQDAATAAARDVLAERGRQVEAEGWSPAHDDAYKSLELNRAAACYISFGSNEVPSSWPWPREWWKPTNYRRNLVKAGALILAEIERVDRAAALECTKGGEA